MKSFYTIASSRKNILPQLSDLSDNYFDNLFVLLGNVFSNLFGSKFYYLDYFSFHFFYFTNLDLFLFFSFIISGVYIYISIQELKIIVTTPYHNLMEFIYEWLANSMYNQNGKVGEKNFSIYFTLFWFILTANLLGMIPYSFTTTSHIFQTFSFGCSLLVSLTILGILQFGYKWFKLFFPNVPIFVMPLFTFIETASYISRAFSLSIRLFANLMSGHTLLNILTGFILKIALKGFVFFLLALIPFVLICAIVVLEILIAMLQAYVFVTLFSVYLNDVYYQH